MDDSDGSGQEAMRCRDRVLPEQAGSQRSGRQGLPLSLSVRLPLAIQLQLFPCILTPVIFFQARPVMSNYLRGVILSVGLVLAVTPAVPACINDREVESHERELKSNYLDQPTPSPPASSLDLVWTTGASGLGVGLLLGAAVVGLVRLPRR
jgi:hypothetical protein